MKMRVDGKGIELVGVIGGGVMGGGIAEVCARSGSSVVVVEPDAASWARLVQQLENSLSKRPASSSTPEVLGRVKRADGFDDISDCSLVIEALPEIASLKIQMLAEVSETVSPDAIIASNTSSIPLADLAGHVRCSERFLGIHFFNPAPVMQLVEIVPTLLTSAEVVGSVRSYLTRELGKVAIEAPDRAGFIVNVLLVPYLLAASRMLESRLATAEDIDLGMVRGCNHPLGPLRLMDMIGLDVIVGVADSLYREFGETSYLAPPLLRRMVQAGLLGQKSGQGFYAYA